MSFANSDMIRSAVNHEHVNAQWALNTGDDVDTDGVLFRQMRKVICRLYFWGVATDKTCSLCRDRKECYRMVEDAISCVDRIKGTDRNKTTKSDKVHKYGARALTK